MSAKHRPHRHSAQKEAYPVNSLTPAGVGRSRASLLASAALIALAALGLPGAARAACVSTPQIISGPFAGPVASNGRAITVTRGGKIAGGPDGVDALACAVTTLTIKQGGTILGGTGGRGLSGGVGVSNANSITALANSGAIAGGNGGSAGFGDAGGAGIVNSARIMMLTNSGTIRGGAGGRGGGAGGAGIWNSGSIANSGTITGGNGANGGAASDAIYSAGAHASRPITNSGQIIGNVEIDNQATVTVTGGTGTTFGSWTGGTIRIGTGDLTFAGGDTALGDDLSVDGGAGTVTNKARLQLAAPQIITGNFTQAPAGVLGLDFAGDALGQYGALTTTKLTTLDGGLAIDLAKGFTLDTGDSFDIFGFGSLAGPGFDTLALDGSACSSAGMDKWPCGRGVRPDEVINAASLDLVVAHASAAFGPGGSSPILEPSTWRCSPWASSASAGSVCANARGR
jgi:hypothetical protein